MPPHAIAAPDLRISVVLAVARLGEADMRKWWRTNAVSRAGQYVLGNAFPKTKLVAGFELDVLSATRRHEDLLGRPTALHLFSDHLPFRRLALAWLSEMKVSHDISPIEELAALNQDEVVERLREWSGGANGRGEAVGPGLLLGQLTPQEIEDAETQTSLVKMLGAGYLDQGQELRPPYFDLKT